MLWMKELTSQYGSLNMMLRLLMPCLCTGSSFALTLFLQHCRHVSHSLPHSTISDATTHMGAITFSISPLKAFQATDRDESLANNNDSYKKMIISIY
jgi:hypothetical protein